MKEEKRTIDHLEMVGKDNSELMAEELDSVSGGFISELSDYVDLLNRHGYTAQAQRLQKSGTFGFSRTLKEILSELGFPEKIEYFVSQNGSNLVYMNGRGVGSLTLQEKLEEYFTKGADYYGMF